MDGTTSQFPNLQKCKNPLFGGLLQLWQFIKSRLKYGISEQLLHNTLAVRDKLSRAVGGSISVSTWLDRYLKIQEERIEANEITKNTVKQKLAPVKAMRAALATKPIGKLIHEILPTFWTITKTGVIPEWPR